MSPVSLVRWKYDATNNIQYLPHLLHLTPFVSRVQFVGILARTMGILSRHANLLALPHALRVDRETVDECKEEASRHQSIRSDSRRHDRQKTKPRDASLLERNGW